MRAKIFLGFTSNLISSGVREHIRYLVQHNMVDVLVTTAGGVEEDLIKVTPPALRVCWLPPWQCALGVLLKAWVPRAASFVVRECMLRSVAASKPWLHRALPSAGLALAAPRVGMVTVHVSLVHNGNECLACSAWAPPTQETSTCGVQTCARGA